MEGVVFNEIDIKPTQNRQESDGEETEEVRYQRGVEGGGGGEGGERVRRRGLGEHGVGSFGVREWG
jgi:hypothetical protein